MPLDPRRSTLLSLGSDDYRDEHGRVCANKPVRADYLDSVVWDHTTALLADPALIRAEITQATRAAPHRGPGHRPAPASGHWTGQGHHGDQAAIGAFQEELISLDELRTRMPELRAREASLRQQLDALDSQLAAREVYL